MHSIDIGADEPIFVDELGNEYMWEYDLTDDDIRRIVTNPDETWEYDVCTDYYGGGYRVRLMDHETVAYIEPLETTA